MNNDRLVGIAEELDSITLDEAQGLRSVSPRDVAELLRQIICLLFPYADFPEEKRVAIDALYSRMIFILGSIDADEQRVRMSVMNILGQLPTVKRRLINDARAIYRGDPAASSVSEIMLCYPGFFAVCAHRIANLFYSEGIPIIPRIMSEIAHSHTGIDIHPGARIGDGLCIDHGTGVVIGETATIGDRVKIYQGVTIGAKSFEADDSGALIKGKKRHPDIGNDCVIYAGATILGGKTIIGDNCIIGGNVWITHSVPSGSTVQYNKK